MNTQHCWLACYKQFVYLLLAFVCKCVRWYVKTQTWTYDYYSGYPIIFKFIHFHKLTKACIYWHYKIYFSGYFSGFCTLKIIKKRTTAKRLTDFSLFTSHSILCIKTVQCMHICCIEACTFPFKCTCMVQQETLLPSHSDISLARNAPLTFSWCQINLDFVRRHIYLDTHP